MKVLREESGRRMGVLDGALDIVSDMLDAARRRRKLKKHKQFQVRVFH